MLRHESVDLLTTNLGVRGSNPFGRANLFKDLGSLMSQFASGLQNWVRVAFANLPIPTSANCGVLERYRSRIESTVLNE